MPYTVEDLDAYTCGKCMYLAAALHRQYGWSIQVVLAQHEITGLRTTFQELQEELRRPDQSRFVSPSIGHAWVVEPVSGMCVDIDGRYASSQNGWDNGYDTVVSNLNEAELRELTNIGTESPLSVEEWNARVAEAAVVVKDYLAQKLFEPIC